MSCERYEELLHQFFDKALDGPRTAELKSHLETCSSCRVDFHLYQSLIQGLEQMGEVAPPAGFTRGVMDGIAQETGSGLVALAQRHESRGGSWLFGLSTLAAAAAVIAGLIVWNIPAPQGGNLPEPDLIAQIDERLAPSSVVTPEERIRDIVAAPSAEVVLTVADGEVQVQRAHGSTWDRVALRTALAYGDKVRTLPDARAQIEYTSDQTYLKLRPGTLLQVLSNAVRVYHGDTWIRVDKVGSRFQAETPNAVASVRGTRYAAGVRYSPAVERIFESPSYDQKALTRKFLQLYLEELSHEKAGGLLPMAAYPLHASPVTVAIQVSMLDTSLDAMVSAETRVQVFESKVWVSALDPVSGDSLDETILEEGHQTSVHQMQLAKISTLDESDYTRWLLPPDTALLERVRRPASTAAAGEVPGVADLPARSPLPEPASSAAGPESLGRPGDEGGVKDLGFGGIDRR